MPHRCVRCGKFYPNASEAFLNGCECGSRFFFFVREEHLQQMKQLEELPLQMTQDEKVTMEKEIREIIGVVDDDTPVILDLESIRVTGDGKFELDLVRLFNEKQPIIYRLEEGKYIIDLASTLQRTKKTKQLD